MIDIKSLLKQKGLRYTSSIEEYTDHFMTIYENHLEVYGKGQAEVYTRLEINRLNHQQINSDYFKLYYKNKLIMASSVLTVLTFIFFLNTTTSPADPPSVNPMNFSTEQISSEFGMRSHPVSKVKKKHTGIDLKAAIGEDVFSTSSGIIKKATYDEKYGFYIEIQHDNIYTTRYHHLSSLNVTEDEQVNAGDKIGEVGSSGFSTGPHLHYEVLVNGEHVDPRKFLKS